MLVAIEPSWAIAELCMRLDVYFGLQIKSMGVNAYAYDTVH